MNYIGEHLWPGYLGHFFIILSLVASLVATFAYFKVVRSNNSIDAAYWKNLARGAFITEAVSVVAIFGILFFIINNHFFEYRYAWQHSSRSLETKYLLSCFWEGQEGSFLLWSFWHCMLGLVMIRKGKQWEAPVMTVVSFAQVFLATMLAGLYFFGEKVGSNPFTLLRNEGMFDGAPQFMSENGTLIPDYLSKIRDGNDLNPLLQNYWMVIHPPVLFLGFASTIIPFGFAFAGLWTKKFGDWTRAALPWALFSIAVLGTGIMMGGAWAYESLNFGGYWAWDPVENASLVPWLVMIAGIHTLLIYRHTGRSLRATYFFFLLSFGLVLYSTFLTRTGILGDTSVHAFTGEGKSLFYHLEVFMAVFLIPAFVLFALRYKNIPHEVKEEQTSSREFWMFIGSLVFFLTALFIIGATSLPVINKFGTNLTMGAEPVYSYNRIIIWVAIVIGILTAITQYLKYKQTGAKFFWSKIIWPTVISLAIASLVLAFGNINYVDHGNGFLAAIWFALACSIFSVVANAGYIWLGMKGKLSLSGASVAHLGFGLLLVGILISSSKKEIMSWNTSGIFVPLGEGSKEKAGENLTLVKGVPTRMGDYMVTYESDSMHPKKQLWYYKLGFKQTDGNKEFSLMPNAFINYKGNQGLMANPDAKRFWNYDIFTYITSLPDPEKNIDTTSFQSRSVKIGDTIFYSRGYAVLENLESHKDVPGIKFGPNDSASFATIKVVSNNFKKYESRPILINKGGEVFMQPDTIMPQDLVFQLQKVNGKTAELGIKESEAVMKYLTLKAYKFPFINLVWGGTILMVIGIFISMARRISLNKAADEAENLTL